MEAQITITDTHTHLYAEEFDQDRNEMMQRALDAGVSRFFIPAIDITCTQAMYDLENDYPENYPSHTLGAVPSSRIHFQDNRFLSRTWLVYK